MVPLPVKVESPASNGVGCMYEWIDRGGRCGWRKLLLIVAVFVAPAAMSDRDRSALEFSRRRVDVFAWLVLSCPMPIVSGCAF